MCAVEDAEKTLSSACSKTRQGSLRGGRYFQNGMFYLVNTHTHRQKKKRMFSILHVRSATREEIEKKSAFELFKYPLLTHVGPSKYVTELVTTSPFNNFYTKGKKTSGDLWCSLM